jgi:hypothetical protein
MNALLLNSQICHLETKIWNSVVPLVNKISKIIENGIFCLRIYYFKPSIFANKFFLTHEANIKNGKLIILARAIEGRGHTPECQCQCQKGEAE